MNDDEPELFVPRPGSVVWRVLDHLITNPNSELTRADVSAKFGCSMSGVDTMMQKPLSRGCLVKSRNSNNLLVWKLGLVKTFRLDPIPADLHVPHEQPEAVIGKALPAQKKWTAATSPSAPAETGEVKPWVPVTVKAHPPARDPLSHIPYTSRPAAVEPEHGEEKQRLRAPPHRREPALASLRILAMCPFKDTVIVATETGAFMYSLEDQKFKPIPFAAQ